MATSMKQVLGTVYAYEHSELLDSTSAELIGEDIFIPPNVAQVSLGIKRKSGAGLFKVQITYSTRDEIYGLSGATDAEWFDWDIPGLDASGWADEDQVQWWIPIPSGMRIVLAAGTGTQVYFSARAN